MRRGAAPVQIRSRQRNPKSIRVDLHQSGAVRTSVPTAKVLRIKRPERRP
jgi:hypothetical protein